MKQELYQQYMKLTRYLEEPIREIVPAIWQLPYVVDTRYCCSGHVITQRTNERHDWEKSSPLTEERVRKGFYPHRATMEIDFTLEEVLQEERDAFMNALRNVRATVGARTLYFSASSGHLDETQESCYKRERSSPFGTPFPLKGPNDIQCV